MLSALLIGAVSALIATTPELIHAQSFTSPLALLVVAVAAAVIQKFILDRRPGYPGYDGLADIMVHIQLPASPDSSFRWLARGFISFLLAIFGGAAGPEGAAIELTQAMSIRMRDRSARWFEQRRRTDAASALAGAFAAAFGAPFAALLLPVELGIGGRHISTAAAALCSFLTSRYLLTRAMSRSLDFGGVLYQFQVKDPREWLVVLVVAVIAGTGAAAVVRFVAFFKESLREVFGNRTWLRTLAAGILLSLLSAIHTHGFLSGSSILEQVLWAHQSPREAALLLCVHFLGLAAVLAGFGTAGVFWPVLALGALLGFETNYWLAGAGSGSGIGFSASAALIGGAALWTGVFGTPVAASVAAYEMSSNPSAMVPVFVAGSIALWIRRRLRTGSMMDADLAFRGMDLLQGKSLKILDALRARDAMVTDHETVPEQEPVTELHARILRARYPFLPVVNATGHFAGLLTVDMVQEAWKAGQAPSPPSEGGPTRAPLTSLLEAKDLLYRFGAESGSACPKVRDTDSLSRAALLTSDHACVPVVSEQEEVVGLLFAHNVRLAYDREVARRSLLAEVFPVSTKS